MQERPLVVALVSDDPHCRAVLRMATELACRYEGMVLPVHVARREFVMVGSPGFLPPQEPGARQAAHERVAERVREVAGPLAASRLRLASGDPAAVLARTAGEVRADLVVLGQPALWRGMLARRTARRLLGRCQVPVLVVPTADSKPSVLRRVRRAFGADRKATVERELARMLRTTQAG